MKKFLDVFKRAKSSVIGMVHLLPLPGSPLHSVPMTKITDVALKEAEIYLNAGVDSIMLENMHDIPYLRSGDIGPEVTVAMTTAAVQLRRAFPDVPMGIQILTSANREALAVAKCADLDYIRCEGFAFAHIGDEGWIDAVAGPLLRYRKYIDAEDVLVFADVKKKHSSHSITSDVTITEAARAMEFFLCDGVIVTGAVTGRPADTDQLRDVLKSVEVPVLVGSGVTIDNLTSYIDASAFIIGSHFKVGGVWKNTVDARRVKDFMKKLNYIR